MNLQLVTTGNFVSTCDGGGIHTPLIWGFCGHDIRVLLRPNMPADRAMVFVQTDAAKSLGYKCPVHAARSMGLTEPEDQGMEFVSTPGGPQRIKVLTFKGLSKLLMRSDHKKALEFQDWLASKSSDLTFHGVAFRDQSAEQGLAKVSNTDQVLAQMLTSMTQAIAEMPAKVLAGVIESMSKTVSVIKKPRDPLLTNAGRNRMHKGGFLPANAFLQVETGNTHHQAGLANGLTSRCLHYVEKFRAKDDAEHFHRFTDAGKTAIYIHADILKIVHRNNWKSGDLDPLTCSLMEDATRGKLRALPGGKSEEAI